MDSKAGRNGLPRQRKCAECGVSFMDETGGQAYCFPCDLKIRAYEPPDELKDMRMVYGGMIPETNAQRILKDILTSSPRDFLRLKKEAEASYRDALTKLKQEPQQSEVESSQDGGTDRVQDLIRRLLNECKG